MVVDRRERRSHTDTAEDEALRLLVHRRDEILDRLRPVLFGSPRRRAAYELLVTAPDLHSALDIAAQQAIDGDGASDAVRALLARLAVEEPDGDPDRVLIDLARYASNREIDALRADAAAAVKPEELRAIVDCIDWLRHRLEELDAPDTRTQAAGQLVAWLADHGEGRADG
jgi:hypothetical protein